MSLGAEAWWSAMMGAAQFEDGSLVIEDDTLDVDGGSTVNLRVKLGARPRSDVTVALSEASDLISLGTDELTFTPANWDSYQSVVVTASVGRQSFSLPSGNWRMLDGITYFVRGWGFGTPGLNIDAGFGADRSLVGFDVDTRQIVRVLVSDRTTAGDISPSDLSDAFEQNGSAELELGASSWRFSLAGADTSEPYIWSPSNSADVTAAYNAMPSATAGTLILRDYAPGDATISLSASGPDEYAGVTDSATVTVD